MSSKEKLDLDNMVMYLKDIINNQDKI